MKNNINKIKIYHFLAPIAKNWIYLLKTFMNYKDWLIKNFHYEHVLFPKIFIAAKDVDKLNYIVSKGFNY